MICITRSHGIPFLWIWDWQREERKREKSSSFFPLNLVLFAFHFPRKEITYAHAQIKNLPNGVNYKQTEDTLTQKVTDYVSFLIHFFFFPEKMVCPHYSRESVGFLGYYKVPNNTLILICWFLMTSRNLPFLPPFLQSIHKQVCIWWHIIQFVVKLSLKYCEQFFSNRVVT